MEDETEVIVSSVGSKRRSRALSIHSTQSISSIASVASIASKLNPVMWNFKAILRPFKFDKVSSPDSLPPLPSEVSSPTLAQHAEEEQRIEANTSFLDTESPTSSKGFKPSRTAKTKGSNSWSAPSPLSSEPDSPYTYRMVSKTSSLQSSPSTVLPGCQARPIGDDDGPPPLPPKSSHFSLAPPVRRPATAPSARAHDSFSPSPVVFPSAYPRPFIVERAQTSPLPAPPPKYKSPAAKLTTAFRNQFIHPSATSSKNATSTGAEVCILGWPLPARRPFPHGVFGRPLEELIDLSKGQILPAIAVRCLDYLNHWADRGELGLYRVPGSLGQVVELKMLFNAGADVNLMDRSPDILDPHAVASVFKQWLRELPESLFTNTVEPDVNEVMLQFTGAPATSRHSLTQAIGSTPTAYQAVSQININQPSPVFLNALYEVLMTLPKLNRYLLREVARHLDHLADQSDRTMMTLDNLRLILSPTLKMSPAMLQVIVEQRQKLFEFNPDAPPTPIADKFKFSATIDAFPTPPPSPAMVAYVPRRDPNDEAFFGRKGRTTSVVRKPFDDLRPLAHKRSFSNTHANVEKVTESQPSPLQLDHEELDTAEIIEDSPTTSEEDAMPLYEQIRRKFKREPVLLDPSTTSHLVDSTLPDPIPTLPSEQDQDLPELSRSSGENSADERDFELKEVVPNEKVSLLDPEPRKRIISMPPALEVTTVSTGPTDLDDWEGLLSRDELFQWTLA